MSVVTGTNKVKAESNIMFQCDRKAGTGKPEFLTGLDCDVQFLWKTSVVCPPISSPCSVVADDHLYDLSLLSKSVGAWNLTDKDDTT